MRKNILSVMISYFSSDKYYIFIPGQFISSYEHAKFELTQLEYSDLLPNLDKNLLPLIKKQELATIKFNNLESREKWHK